MRDDERRRLGPGFSLKRFHDALIYAGSLPVSFHRRLLAGEGPGPAEPRPTARAVMQIIPSIDLKGGRSRLVFWPGAATGTGTPTDRPERIARHFVELGAPAIHLVDLDGAAAGQPVNIAAVQAIARSVATPLQLAGGVDGPEQIELAFAAGATRVVMPLLAVAEDRGSPRGLPAHRR